MITKALIKDIRALHQPKFRQIYNKFIAEGDKVCIELIKSPKYEIDDVIITSTNEHKYLKILKNKFAAYKIASPKEMEQISTLKTPGDILLLLKKKEENLNIFLQKKSTAIYLDGVQDPGNVGTIIRIADWFGINAVVRSADSADFFNPKVVQATMGSLVNVDLISTTLQDLTGFDKIIFGADMAGIDIQNADMNQGSILVVGSEGKGISADNEKYIQTKVSIPGVTHKIAESLNVGVATGIICAHWMR